MLVRRDVSRTISHDKNLLMAAQYGTASRRTGMIPSIG